MTSVKNKVILHAEDEPAHAEIVGAAIRISCNDVQLRQVDDGKAALDYLYRRGSYADSALSPRPDLILLDLRMPQICGLEVLAIVKSDPELQAIPVVVLTTSNAEEDRSTAKASGVNGYLTKPVNFDAFLNMMDELCTTWL